jgi:RNase P subunit RPR2
MNKKLLGLILGIAILGVLLVIISAYSAESGDDQGSEFAVQSTRGARISWMNETINATWRNSSHANSFHGGVNNNTYCAHCMSPFQADPMANYTNNIGIEEQNWSAINCTVCHDPVTQELSFYNGTDWEPPVSNPSDLCGECHQGDHHPEYADWNSSAHADTFHAGANNNTYCAHCMSPYQSDPAANYTNNVGIEEANWTSVGCTVCHEQHSLKLGVYDGSEFNEVDDISRELCGACHTGSHHTETADWNSSVHADTFMQGVNNNTYCAHCMSPYSAGPEDNWDQGTPVTEENWTSVGCIVCHDKHSLEVAFFNGSEYNDVEDISRDLCGACHTGSHHTETADWNSSVHASSTVIPGVNNNTYCAHCMSPFQGDPDASSSDNEPVDVADWEGIGCIVCHDKHSLELVVFNGSAYQEVEDISRDLCGACHTGSHHTETADWNSSAHADTFHAGSNNNTYCAHCMSPYQAGPEDEWDRDTPVLEEDWDSIGCIVCHDKHSLELVIFNGSEYNPVEDISRDLCGACHQGSHHTETADWNSSAHADTYHAGANNNTYCAHCMSPYQAGPEAEWDRDVEVLEEDWESIGCIVCHDKHSLELVFFNGSEYNPVDDISRDLCGACHQGSHHPETAEWNSSAHAHTYHAGANNNTYCAHCMSPYQAGPEAEWDRDVEVLEEDWDSIGCIVCHDKHSLEIKFFNGSEYNDVDDVSKDLCGACHQGSHHPETAEWMESGHANSYHGYNGNTYCAHCMSPFQYEEGSTSSSNNPVSEENWTAIGCTVCHHPHSLELRYFNGTEYEDPVTDPSDLCGGCHNGDRHPQYDHWVESAHANSFHEGSNNNTYCAHCMSPYQAGPEEEWNRDTPVLEADWDGIGCIVCHNKHSLELELFNGSEYNPIEDISRDLCGACHQGSHHPETAEWNASAHANTYHGYNGNTYCAHCMSPFQYDEAAVNSSVADPVSEENWTAIGCIVCHDQHSLELSLFNGTGREEAVKNPAELCGGCHEGSRHPQYPNWVDSKHALTGAMDKGNNNTFCARCHSPLQADSEATVSSNEGIAAGDGTGVTCTVCHTPHSLELKFWDGSEYVDVDEDPNILCSKCHSGTSEFAGAPFVIDIYGQWNDSAHSNTYKGFNGNTYCAHCMSPFQSGDEAVQAARDPVSEENWTSIGCLVCHEQHSLVPTLYNGSAYIDIKDNTNTLCGSCHTMGDAEKGDEPHHSQIEMRTGTGGYGVVDMPFMPSAQCAGCHAYENNHTFEFHAPACVDCHSTYTNESAQQQVTDWQNKIIELMGYAEVNLTKAEILKANAEAKGTWTESMNDTYYEALFNYQFVEADGSHGAHNHKYSEELLKQANKSANDIIDAVEFLPPIAVSPANGATDVPISTVITVTFEEDINFTGLEDLGLLTVSSATTGTVSYDNTTFMVTFTPTNNLDYKTIYEVTLSKDVKYADQSVVLLDDYTWSFTTEEAPIQEVTIEIGPIEDEDGKAIEGALVTITMNGKEFTGVTDSTGYATITVPKADFVAGDIDVEVTKDKYDTIKFTGSVDANGTFTPPTDGIPDMKSSEKEEEDDWTLIIIAIIIVIIVIVVLVAFATRSREAEEEEEEEEAEEGEEEEEEEEEEEFECPDCGATVAPGETECPECGAEFEEEEEEEGEEEELEDEELEEEELGEEELGEEELEEEELEEEELEEGLEEEELEEGLEEEELGESLEEEEMEGMEEEGEDLGLEEEEMEEEAIGGEELDEGLEEEGIEEEEEEVP